MPLSHAMTNRKFELSFSEKAIKNNTITMVVFTVMIALLSLYVGIKSATGWFGLMLTITCLSIAACGIFYTRNLVRYSYLEITSDDTLRCCYRGRRKIEYPIKEIKFIEEATLKQAAERHATFPIVLNTKGEELYPSEGVLITFNRAWKKSIFPVYFNPSDIPGFIETLKQRIKVE